MRIGYIVGQFPSLSETFILREVKELYRQGSDMRIFSLSQSKTHKVHKDAEAFLPLTTYGGRSLFPLIRVHFCYLLRFPFTYGDTLFRTFLYGFLNLPDVYGWLVSFIQSVYFASIVKERNISHLHAHFASRPAMVALLTARLAGRTFSFAAHARDVYVEGKSLRIILRQASFAVACSKHLSTYLVNKYGEVARRKVFMIYHGVNLQKYPLRRKKRESRILILSVGRLEEKKGFAYLIKACHILKERGYTFISLVVGEGARMNRLRVLQCSYGLEQVLHFKGSMTEENLIPFYSRADIFVLPCVVSANGDQDNLPNVIIEALAMGLPVVSTPLGGIPEIIRQGQTGLIVPPGNPVAIADAIQRLGNDDTLRQRLGSNGHNLVREKFDIQKNVHKLRQLFFHD